MALTTIIDLDRIILHYLSDSSLCQLMQVNRRMYRQTQEDEFWHQRIYTQGDSRYGHQKHSNLTWRQWYIFWKHHSVDPIGSTLNLSPIQAYIRLRTETGIMKGSERYQGIRVLLSKALRSQDSGLIEYYLHRLDDEFDSYLKEEDPCRIFLDYAETISIPLRNGDLELAKQLVSFLDRDAEKCYVEENNIDLINQEYLQLVTVLGSINRRDFVDKFLDYPASLYESSWTIDDAFLAGLIEGHHNEAAKKMHQQLVENNVASHPNYYYNSTLESNNQEFIDYLRLNGLDSEYPDISQAPNLVSRPIPSYAYIQTGQYDKMEEWIEWVQREIYIYSPNMLESSDYFDLQAYAIIHYARYFPLEGEMCSELLQPLQARFAASE